jgi:hypothetical protein
MKATAMAAGPSAAPSRYRLSAGPTYGERAGERGTAHLADISPG